ncbi:TlpA family protein disulfide reductase [Leeuwenhoekiella marinoflava]|uniref:Thiol-disulfide isomerase/thioredoxin n=2 Tax=Leeuwenhoekiella marinoflava TaxID=988 RepID=A0A4Q0PP07_9FLAO|nr:TlpA disulfide reductase family protein [Leeuwenhoekiella marinoflava]RXG32309.1 thiol-disulfide isomerase/thioredoxin [Leeuwenhoekiella marinoflava]SHE79597.1 Thiol-disulfide isomerase or thioredoxin [Leeuwenhoekiella marinoflava DSM 3653]
MKNNLLFLVFILFLTSGCKKEQEFAVIHFKDIEQFPYNIIATRITENAIAKTDTFNLESQENAVISLEIKRPQYVYIQRNSENSRLFLTPGTDLTIGQKNGRDVFEGDLKGENTYLEEFYNTENIEDLSWDYNASFDTFKNQTSGFFNFMNNLLDTYVPDSTSYFYRLNKLENRAFENSAILDYVLTRTPSAKKDSLFDAYIDKDLFDFKKFEAYSSANYLKSFYEKKGFEYFARKKYGERLDSLRNAEEHYVFTSDIIAEYIPAPFKSTILYDNLKYYPEEFDFVPDSLKAQLTTPHNIVERYKEHLNEKTYEELIAKIERHKANKLRYAKETVVPDFSLQNDQKQSINFKEVYKNKPILIDVWASWCGPCIRSFPKVRELQEQYKTDLEVISISIDKTFDLFQKGLDKHQVPGSSKLYAEGGFSSTFATHFNIVAIPRYILISQNGTVIDATISLKDLKAKLNSSMP